MSIRDPVVRVVAIEQIQVEDPGLQIFRVLLLVAAVGFFQGQHFTLAALDHGHIPLPVFQSQLQEVLLPGDGLAGQGAHLHIQGLGIVGLDLVLGRAVGVDGHVVVNLQQTVGQLFLADGGHGVLRDGSKLGHRGQVAAFAGHIVRIAVRGSGGAGFGGLFGGFFRGLFGGCFGLSDHRGEFLLNRRHILGCALAAGKQCCGHHEGEGAADDSAQQKERAGLLIHVLIIFLLYIKYPVYTITFYAFFQVEITGNDRIFAKILPEKRSWIF